MHHASHGTRRETHIMSQYVIPKSAALQTKQVTARRIRIFTMEKDMAIIDDSDEVDLDILVKSLHAIADRESTNNLAQIDYIYEKTIKLTSPRITKSKGIQLTAETGINQQSIAMTSSPPLSIESLSVSRLDQPAEVRMCIDDLISRVELNNEEPLNNFDDEQGNKYKVQYETILIYVKKLQNQNKVYQKEIQELKYERDYALHAFDIVAAEYDTLKQEKHICKEILKTNENFKNKILTLVKENRKLNDDREELLRIINEGIVIEDAILKQSTKNEMKSSLKQRVEDKLSSFLTMKNRG